MKNKFVLGLVAIFALGVSVGSYQYYKENVETIHMTQEEAYNTLNIYGVVENCSKLGLIAKTKDSELIDIVKRISYTDENNNIVYVDMQDLQNRMDKMLTGILSDKTIDVTSTFSLGAGMFKVACQNNLEKAQNIKTKYQ